MDKFSVRAFHDSFGERPVLMNLSFPHFGKMLIESEDAAQKWEWSVESMIISKGGANNQLFLITHKDQQGWMLYVRDYQVIKEIKRRYPHKKVPPKNLLDTGISLALAAILFLLVAIFGLYMAKDFIADKIVKEIPKKYDKKMGEFFVNNLVSNEETKRFARANSELQKLLAPLFKVAENEAYDFQVYISDKKEINAFALPGGILVFNRGMLEAVDHPEEIAGVAAHEMAHVVKRHSFRQILSSLGTYSLFQFFLGDYSGIMAVFADNGAFLLTRMYSRETEKEADFVGLNYLKKANINPKGLVSFFDKLKFENQRKIEELEKKGIPLSKIDISLISTHPDTDERIAYLQSQISKEISSKEKKYLELNIDLEKFKKLLGYQQKED
ncbi:MAG: M48 family metallopeptidase [Bdellovibrionaceae bacterium]|nr:M48 family metallopeptidase [Pseudobdellovibrionaceae bacterium]